MSSALANPDFEIALLGGGQLGKMFLAEALRMDVGVRALDPDAEAPCRWGVRRFQVGDFKDYATVMSFAQGAQAAVIEIETVNVDALADLEAAGVRCFPPASALRIIQNKGAQKDFWAAHGLPTSHYERFEGAAGLREAVDSGRWTLPLVWKLAQGGYDGFGVSVVRERSELDALPEQACVAETLVEIAEEIGVIVARHPDGSTVVFPPVAMEFHPVANQVEFVVCPAPLPAEALAEAEQLARRAATELGVLGLLAVEFFYTRDGRWLINEVAPRPHNSGHLSIEGCETSQFEQLLRCATGLPLGSTALRQPSVMANVVGAEGFRGPVAYEGLDQALAVPGAHLHLYGKTQTRPFRKLGHWTAVGSSVDEARSRAAAARDALKAQSTSKL